VFAAADTLAVLGLSHVQLTTLAGYYNDTFGIVAGDDLATRRKKFMDWCRGL
jgi:hypothetical protein